MHSLMIVVESSYGEIDRDRKREGEADRERSESSFEYLFESINMPEI